MSTIEEVPVEIWFDRNNIPQELRQSVASFGAKYPTHHSPEERLSRGLRDLLACVDQMKATPKAPSAGDCGFIGTLVDTKHHCKTPRKKLFEKRPLLTVWRCCECYKEWAWWYNISGKDWVSKNSDRDLGYYLERGSYRLQKESK